MSNTGFYECPLDHKRFTTEKSFIGHLANHKKKGDITELDTIRSQVIMPTGDALRAYVENYAKALPKVANIRPRRNDTETISAFITKVCNDRGIKLECPHCHTKFIPEGDKNG